MLRKDLKTRILASGAELTIPVFYFQGTDEHAPSAYIQSGIHGAEVQGYLVALKLIEYFAQHPPKGDVTIVPIANPYGLNLKMGEHTFGRFDPMTGDNWNRNYVDESQIADHFFKQHAGLSFDELIVRFKDKLKETISTQLRSELGYHKKLALQLRHLAVSADVVLDLHCDTVSVSHVYCPTYAMNSISHLGIPFVIEIPHTFGGALDEAVFCPWVTLTEHYNAHHRENQSPPVDALTVELGNQEMLDEKRALEQVQGILNYFSVKKVIGEKQNTASKKIIYTCKLEHFLTIYASCGGLALQFAALGQIQQANHALITLSDTQAWSHLENVSDLIKKSTHSICRDDDSIPITHSVSAVLHEGMALMKVMTQYKKIE